MVLNCNITEVRFEVRSNGGIHDKYRKVFERAGPGMFFSSRIRSIRVVGMAVVVLTAHRLVAKFVMSRSIA